MKTLYASSEVPNVDTMPRGQGHSLSHVVHRVARQLALWTVAVLALSACGGGGGGGDSDSGPKAYGKAHMSSGLVDATVELQGNDGQVVDSQYGKTRANGSFVVAVPSGRKAFRLSFSGGTHAGAPFDGKLVLDVENFDASRDLLYANAVTTLAARYRDRHQTVSVAEANTRVKRYLGIPANSNPGFDVANPKQVYFAHADLLQKASASGTPLVSYLDGLVDEMDRGVARRSFVLAAGSPAVSDLDAIKKFFTKAGKGLLENLGDELFSWGFESILTALGVGSQAEVLEQLHEINAKLDEITNLVNEVLSEAKQTEAEILAAALLGPVADITAQYHYLTLAVENAQLACILDKTTQKPADPVCAEQLRSAQSDVRDRMKAILNPNVGIIHDVELIRAAMVKTASERGLILRWNDYLRTEYPFYGQTPYEELTALATFYNSVQLIGTNLIVEAYMAQSPSNKTSARYYAQLHSDAIDAQDALIAQQHSPEGTIQDNRTQLTWQKAPWSHFDPLDSPTRDPERYSYLAAAETMCGQLRTQAFGGFSAWRLPTDPELHEVVKGSPNPTGNADGGTGIFGWLRDHGFAYSDDRSYLVRAFVEGNAYLSSTKSGITGYYHEALWDRGVDNVVVWGSIGSYVGVWCVTDETKIANAR